jgi:hypothetical protein
MLIEALLKLYNGLTSKIKIGKTLSNSFPVSEGLRQGCCLSPTLFEIYVKKDLETWKKKCKGKGIQLHDNICLYIIIII